LIFWFWGLLGDDDEIGRGIVVVVDIVWVSSIFVV